MDIQLSKEDIEAVFHRLRAIQTNKVCFDCNAKNPTWASVTYGVFICLDCSAVHRSLGVHLTFVRSTQLDTNWTALQLRQMQLGGNSNALQFFSQYNCNTNDAQKKYNSRAAQLYREKLSQAAMKSLKSSSQLHVHTSTEEKIEEKDVDFFSEQDHFNSKEISNRSQLHFTESEEPIRPIETTKLADQLNPGEGPKVDFLLTDSANLEPKKSSISSRKPAAKKSTLGAKKSGLGATKVKTNFAELEREAELAEEQRAKAAEEALKMAAMTAKEQEDRDAAVRLAYKDISNQQQKKEEQMRKEDPKKADQLERLGMGMSSNSRSGISHSALSDMQTIEQENAHGPSSTLSSLGKLRLVDNDNFMDDYFYGNTLNMIRNSNSFGDSKMSMFLSDLAEAKSMTESKSSKDSWVIIDDPPEKPKSSSFERETERERKKEKHSMASASSSDEAQKKFGNAKAISSDQFFNDASADYEAKANLSRFQGSSSISSAEFFGNGKETNNSNSNMPQYDLEDVKESVRQGVTKVAEKLGSLANGLVSSIQDRYTY